MKKRQQQRRQKALMKRRQRKEAQKKKRHPAERSPTQRIRLARTFPVEECLINKSWKESGMARIFLSRKHPDGDLIFASYLVDVFCLGLKDTMCNVDMSSSRLNRELKAMFYGDDPAMSCSPHLANQIIYGAIEYAAELGFRPNRDFRHSQYVLEERDPAQEVYDVSFGKDGKPLFISGPHDDGRRIMAMLEGKLGRDGFGFMVAVSPFDEEESEEAEWEEMEEDEEENA